MSSPSFSAKRVLLLQGPVGPFFKNLAKDLRSKGAQVFKFNFNAGDWLFYPTQAQSFRGSLTDWPAQLEAFMRAQRIDVVLLFGDCRPVHVCVRGLAQELGCAVGVFEEGYLRPDYVTFEPVGVNGNSEFVQSLAPWLVQQALGSEETDDGMLRQALSSDPPQQPTPCLPVGNTYWHAAMWGMLYFFTAWLGQWFWNNALHHRPMTVLDAPRWWLSYGRKAWYKIKERKVEAELCGRWKKKFFLVPLQVYNDAQITVHSDFDSVCNFADYVMRSFAKARAAELAGTIPPQGEAMADTKLVFKHHPMDRGHRHYGKALRLLARRYGLQGQVLYIHDQHLPSLLRAARGVVVVNSTVGLSALGHGAPVKVCGSALYNIPGLTFQGHLRQFWHWAHFSAPDAQELRRFKYALVRRTQINGSFYRKLNNVEWACGVALDGQIAQRLWPEKAPEKMQLRQTMLWREAVNDGAEQFHAEKQLRDRQDLSAVDAFAPSADSIAANSHKMKA